MEGYGRVFPSKTLRNVPAFARAFALAYARANAQAKEKGGGVIPECWCEVGVAWMYGRVFPSKTLRNVPAFARAFAQAYAWANAGAKRKGVG